MNFVSWAKTVLYVSLAVFFCFLSYFAWVAAREVKVLGQQASVVLTQAGTSAQSLNATLALVNQPCGGGKPCGVVANLNKTITKVGDAIVTTQLQEHQTAPHVIAAMDTFNTAAQKLGGTATALTGTANEATATLGEGQRVIASASPLLAQSTETITDLDALLKDSAIHQTLSHVESISSSADTIAADAAFEANKLTHPPKAKLTGWVIVQSVVKYIHELTPPFF